jgi:hypothetical protein
MKKCIIIVLLCVGLLFKAFSIDAWVYNGTGQSTDNKLIALTLAGIVNRDAPRLYLRNVYETWSWSETDEQWEEIYKTRGGVNFTVTNDINALVQVFKPFLKGKITYNPGLTYSNFTGQSFRWQAEAAAMLGGLTDCIPVVSGNTSINITGSDMVDVPDHFNGLPTIQFSARLEDAAHSWNNTLLTQEQRYFAWLDHAMDVLMPRTNPTRFYLREITDWAVGQRMFQLNLAGTEDLRFTSLSDEKAAKIERVMNYMKSKRPNEIFHVFGWMRPEPLTQWVSAYGGSFHETLLGNLSWHHIFPEPATKTRRASVVYPADVTLENKHYVLFLGSEGDAGNWVVGFQGGAWHSPVRGQVPVGWGFSLQMFEEFPFLADYYASTATANDGFISVATPLGYAYPDVFPAAVLQDARTKSAAMMHKFDVHSVYAYKHYNGAGKSIYRGIEISNNFDFAKLGAFAADTEVMLKILYDPGLVTQRAYTNYGGLLYNHVNDETFYANMSDLNVARDRIINKLNGKSKPSFLLAGYNRFRNDNNTNLSTNDITLPRLKTIMDGVKANASVGADVEFVTPEKFTLLLRKSLGLNTTLDVPDKEYSKPALTISNTGKMRLVNTGISDQKLIIRIFDAAGKIVFNEDWFADGAISEKQLNIDGKGFFVVQLTGTGIHLTAKYIR